MVEYVKEYSKKTVTKHDNTTRNAVSTVYDY